ncbi:hypothetical protein ATCV1_z173R [Acanthocystis turfacea chlorella virus 1]|uniref:Uncharacterized protein z173R n=1 Tax=Chlorovirus heliozoae TaxID=322019 RepID=A7K8D3_9PHYC|nr:hypothetical protein ATCV1_z173R [Acanthocystis turfacea chlorella virus 1]ABT16307.1 hypothetical protein ATCV1_z173R [Acanthocystis turfacea chlorella virus 1]
MASRTTTGQGLSKDTLRRTVSPSQWQTASVASASVARKSIFTAGRLLLITRVASRFRLGAPPRRTAV